MRAICNASNDGDVIHVTQRCYDSQFLLDDEVDRRRLLYWLAQVKRRYNLSILNYVVTSNHVHILLQDPGRPSLEAALVFIKARTTSEFNRRQHRRGGFWEHAYQTTVIQTNNHLARCMTYIDMHMVRAGAVQHPGMWRSSGYFEAIHPVRRGGCLDRPSLLAYLKFAQFSDMQLVRDQWIDNKLATAVFDREAYWSNSVAVGDLAFALKMKRALAFVHPGRRAQREQGCFAVR